MRWSIHPALGTVLDVGPTTLSVAFTPTDTAHYTGSTATVPLLITPGTPSLTWTLPLGITWGISLSAPQLSATSTIPGIPTYTPAHGMVLGLGASTLSVIWNPTDAVHHTTATSIVTIVIERALPGRHLAHSQLDCQRHNRRATRLCTTLRFPICGGD